MNTDWEGAEIAAGLSGKVTYMHSGDDYEREMYANVFKKYMEYAPGVEVEQMYVPSSGWARPACASTPRPGSWRTRAST